MLSVDFRGKIFVGNNIDKLIEEMAKEGVSLRKIAGVLSEQIYPISYETVRVILDKLGIGIKRPELNDISLFEQMTDEEIATKYLIPVSNVIAARKRFDIRRGTKVSSVRVSRRRRWLSKYLFGAKPGANFVSFIESLLKDMPDTRARLIEDFYIKGLDSTEYDRIYRAKARDDLERLTEDFSKETLQKNSVII